MVTQRDIDAWTLHDLRYCLGRMTGAPDECAQRVRLYWPRVSPKMRAILIRDCAEHLDRIARLERGELDGFYRVQREYNARVWAPLLAFMRDNLALPHCSPESEADALEREREAYDAWSVQAETEAEALVALVLECCDRIDDTTDDAADLRAALEDLCNG